MSNAKISQKKLQAIHTRGKILDVATKCFGENGYLGCNLDTIAKAAGITKGAIYTHFSSKAELFIAIIAHAYKKTGDVANSLKEKLSFADAIIELLSECMHNQGFPIDHKLWAEILAVASRDNLVREVFLRCQSELRIIIEQLIADGVQAGEINPLIDIKSVSNMLFVMANGLVVRLSKEQEANSDEDFKIFEITIRNIIKP